MTQTEDNRVRRLYTIDNLSIVQRLGSETADLVYFDLLSTPGK